MEDAINRAQYFILKGIDLYERGVDTVTTHPAYVKYSALAQPWWPTLGRVLICCYFLNHCYTLMLLYHQYEQGSFPFFGYMLLLCTLPVIFNFKTEYAGPVLALMALVDAMSIILNQVWQSWTNSYPLYVNELMVKKLSLFACSLMILLSNKAFRQLLDPAHLRYSSPPHPPPHFLSLSVYVSVSHHSFV